jgi:simple sugar transport system permease protein
MTASEVIHQAVADAQRMVDELERGGLPYKLRAGGLVVGLAGVALAIGFGRGVNGFQVFGLELGPWRLLGKEWTGVDLLAMLVPVVWWVLFRPRPGLALRAAGEAESVARANGVRTGLVRAGATIVGGGFAGLAGATLVLAQVGTFAERMTAGRGYVAIAIVVLGRWHPVGVALASLGFGAAMALQFLFQTLGLSVPYQLFLMLPYGLALLALAGVVGRVRAPADLGKA